VQAADFFLKSGNPRIRGLREHNGCLRGRGPAPTLHHGRLWAGMCQSGHSQQDKSQGGHAAQMGSQQHPFLIISGTLKTADLAVASDLSGIASSAKFCFNHLRNGRPIEPPWSFETDLLAYMPAPPRTVTAR